MTQAGCRLLTLHDMPILRLCFTCVFRVSHGSRTCGMLRTAGSEVLGKDLLFMVAEHLDSQVLRDTWAFRPFGFFVQGPSGLHLRNSFGEF